jgi:hypothetical protein
MCVCTGAGRFDTLSVTWQEGLVQTAVCCASAMLLCTRQNEGVWCVQGCGLCIYLFILAVSAALSAAVSWLPWWAGMTGVVAGSNSTSVRQRGHTSAGAS